MANMYPKNIAEYTPEDSERIVYQELKNQLPRTWDVFYSVPWTAYKRGRRIKSEADFIVCSPEYGFLCLEVKGGNQIRKENDTWYLNDTRYGERKLNGSPYDQAEKSMYYFESVFSNMYNLCYPGIFGAGVVFPFYAVPEELNLDNRQRVCTIDCYDLNHLADRIKKMFRMWAGTSYGLRVYSPEQHRALVELIRDRIAISAAAGALVRYKEQQLHVINRVQDNYVYFLNNVNRFYIKGGAGTGKTWIAKKMALKSAEKRTQNVLFLCASKNLADKVSEDMPENVHVRTMEEILHSISNDISQYKAPLYEGIVDSIHSYPKYDAIYIDEAQDFTKEWAEITNHMLSDDSSKLGVFYDDVQILREESFGNAFAIDGQTYLLRENIRNTANIYKWTSEKTNLGMDVIVNPVEGPTPVVEVMGDHYQLTHKLEGLLKKFLDDEHLSNDSMVFITDNKEALLSEYESGIAKWKLVSRSPESANEIQIVSVEEFKGLESDMVVYIHSDDTTNNMNYIAYTRAKYYLIELIRR